MPRNDWTNLLDPELLDLVDWNGQQLRESPGDRNTPAVIYGPLTNGNWFSARTQPETNGLSVSIAPADKRVEGCEEDLQRAGVAARVGLTQRDRGR